MVLDTMETIILNPVKYAYLNDVARQTETAGNARYSWPTTSEGGNDPLPVRSYLNRHQRRALDARRRRGH